MSDIQRLDSPDRHFYILLTSNEMRMSHWVTSAALWERDPQRLLLKIGQWLWSSEQIDWSADSQRVTIGLRRYPGYAPGIVIDIAVDADALVQLETDAQQQQLPACLVHDAGRTVLPAGMITCLGLGPAPTAVVDGLTGGLPLV